ncbi:MAG: hypothetical protein ACQGVK_15950 [Myxococcota bacterium]
MTHWRLEKSGARFRELSPAVQAKFDQFQDEIHNNGTHPREAAEYARCDGFEELSGGLWSVRLSQGDRVYFKVHEGTGTVEIVEVGGHKKS